MKKRYSTSLIAAFLALMLFFTSFSIFGEKKDFSEKENRALQTLPALSVQAIDDGSFQEEYNDYLSDQFEFRDFWVKAKTTLMLSLGKKDINGIYVGKDGYLIEKYSADAFDAETIDYNIEVLADFLNAAAAQGIGTSLAFVPSKADAIPDKLPTFTIPYDSSFVPARMRTLLDAKVHFPDLRQTLISHKGEYIYYKTDHHWTSRGAYYAYAALMGTNLQTPLGQEQFAQKEVTTDFFGSDYDKLQRGNTADTIFCFDSGCKVDVLYSDGTRAASLFDEAALATKNKYDYFLGGNDAKIEINTSTKNGKTLLLIKDSYSNCLVPMLAEHYERIVMLDLRYMTDDVGEILESEKPDDLFVIFNTESFMKDDNMDLLEIEWD